MNLENNSIINNRGYKCLRNGCSYELKIKQILITLLYNNNTFPVENTGGSTSANDIVIIVNNMRIGIEVKNKGAFEGGCKKLHPTEYGMKILEDCIQRDIIGDTVLYDGMILPWNRGKRTLEDWKEVEYIFKPDIYIDVSDNAISDYYSKKGSHYIQIEGLGLYHTGNDILGLDVPYFIPSNVQLRIRSSKHIKHCIPRDITAGLQFDRKNIVKSPYSLDGIIPKVFVRKPSVDVREAK